MRSIFLTIFAATVITLATSTTYHGYKTYKVHPKTEADNQFLISLQTNKDFDFWSHVNKINLPVSVMVASNVQKQFEKSLDFRNIPYETLIEDVEKSVEKERILQRSKAISNKLAGRITFDQYYRHEEINAYLAQLQQDYPDLVTVETLGNSYENRSLDLIRISSGPLSSGNAKPAIFIDGGIHAREWISVAVALYVINQLVENPEYRSLTDNVDWFVLPVFNPDGYEYTHTDDRFWRKTLSKGFICDGADANRNFDYHWMESGASLFECDETYAGAEAESEIEVRNVKRYIAAAENIQAYINLHSYSQMILTPYAYALAYPDSIGEIEEVGDNFAAAIRSFAGTRYQVGSPPAILYAAAGGGMDWIVAPKPEGAGIDISFAIELPGGGNYGFDLPADEISPVVQETFEGFKSLHDHIVNKFK